MPQPGFFNDNEFRAYPFIAQDAASPYLPTDAVVDFGAIMYTVSGFAAGDSVYLHAVSRAGDTLTFDFRQTGEIGDLATRCLFTRQIGDAEFLTEWAMAEWLSGTPTDSTSCDGFPQWEAFLTTGRMTGLALLLADGDTLTFADSDWPIEPARIQNLAAAYVQTLNLANFPRLIVTPPADCLADLSSESLAPHQDQQLHIQATCLTGQISLREGFNCSIRQEPVTNSLIVGASPGAGKGQPCDELPIYPDEASPDGGGLLTGGPTCRELLRAINGVAGQHLTLLPGSGMRIYAHPDAPHTLVIDRSLHDFAACLSTSSSSIGGG